MPYSRHAISFKNHSIDTLVTHYASDVDRWIKKNTAAKLDESTTIVGLDTEWLLATRYNKHQKVAVLQLNIDHSCLVFQLYHADAIPKSLHDFLDNRRFYFVGKEVENDARKLFEDYDLWVRNIKDVAHWAAEACDEPCYRGMGLKNLVRRFLKQEMEKEKKITMSRWDSRYLSPDQIKYAAIDAFVSYELGVYFSTKKTEG